MYYLSEVIYNVMIPNFIKSSNKILGSSLSLPAHPSSRTLCVHYGAGGRAGARATLLAALFAKQKTKFGGGGTPVVERFAFTTGQEARAGKNSFPPTPFLFARPSENYQKSASGFSRKKVRILSKRDSHHGQRVIIKNFKKLIQI